MKVAKQLSLVLHAFALYSLGKALDVRYCQDCKVVKDGGDLDGRYLLHVYDSAQCPSGCIYTKEDDSGQYYYCFQPFKSKTYTVPCPSINGSDVCGDPSCGIMCEAGEECFEDPDIRCVLPPCCVKWSCIFAGSGNEDCDDDLVCTEDWSPVCGIDGQTYSNRCFACGVEVACDGECPCSDKLKPNPKPIAKTTPKADPETITKSDPKVSLEPLEPKPDTTAKVNEIKKPTHSTYQCKCGIKKYRTRIIGGQGAQVNEYLWMVSLQTTGYHRNNHLCGASLIASRWVVTAAHCFYDGFGKVLINDPQELVAVIGEHDLSVIQEPLLKKIAVEKIMRHEDYDFNSNIKDISLLKLTEDVDLRIYTPVCLPNSGYDYSGKRAWVYGWGTLTDAGGIANKLQELEVPIVSDSTCRNAFKNKDITTLSDDQMAVMVCAGGETGKDSCYGDSGGPLSYDNNGQHELVGVVSWGYGCARPGLYGVYAEVPALRTWIDEIIEKNGGAVYC